MFRSSCLFKKSFLLFLLFLSGQLVFAQYSRYMTPAKRLDSNRIAVKQLIKEVFDRERILKKADTALTEAQAEIGKLNAEIKRLKTHNLQKTAKIEAQGNFLSVYLIAALIALIAVVVLITTIRDKKIINKKLADQHSLVTKSAEDLKEKNKEITDSIKYARRIQEAMLPSATEVRTALPKSFVYYRPKDIVSGDFYWVTEKYGKVFVVTADCTGHGVPGALMSMLGIANLNEIINEKEILSPAKILDELRSFIITSLSKSDGDSMKDGMDLSLYCYDKRRLKLTYAAANNGIYVVRDNNIITLNPDKQPVGSSPNEDRPFTEGSFELKENDFIVTFTDGFADQFGGPKGKKFKYKQLQQLVVELKNKPLHQAPELLNRVFIKWKGNLEQVDDVLIIGVKV